MKTAQAVAELRRMFPVAWSMRRGYRLPDGRLGEPYYVQWSGEPKPDGEGWDGASFDDDGVVALGTYRNPVHIAQYALTQYARACEGDLPARVRFLAQCAWLAAAQRPDGSYPYPIEVPLYHARRGWISGMAQGEAASALLRAFALTNDPRYRDAAVRAISVLERDVQHGGASYLRGNDVFFEEVAVEPLCHILNGHLFAAFAVWEFVRHGIGSAALGDLHEAAVRTLERWLPQYDAGGWSCYDLAIDATGRRHYAPLWYHQFHIAQLRIYGAMTGSRIFVGYAARWSDALCDGSVRARVWRYGAGSLLRAVRRRIAREPVSGFHPAQMRA